MFRKMIGGLSALAALVAGSCASAAPAPPAFTWTGAYVGLNVGGAWSNFVNLDKSSVNCWWCANNYGKNEANIVGGGQLGYNYQMDNIVLGVEAEVGRGLYSSATHAYDPTHHTPDTSLFDDVFGVAAVRLGYSFGPAMIYAKGGVGAVQTNYKWNDPAYSAWATATKTTVGGAYGVGAEYQISPQFSLKAEYLRLDFSSIATLDVQNYSGGYQQHIRIRPIDTFRVGANVRFGGP